MNNILRRLGEVNDISLKVKWRRELLIAKRDFIENQKEKVVSVLESLIWVAPNNVASYLSGTHRSISFLKDITMKPYFPLSLKAKIALRGIQRNHKAFWNQGVFLKEEMLSQIGSALEMLKKI